MLKFDSDSDFKKQWEKCICTSLQIFVLTPQEASRCSKASCASSFHTPFISYHNDWPPSSKCLPIPMPPPQKKFPQYHDPPPTSKGFWWMNEGTNFWKSALHMVCCPHHHMIYWKYQKPLHLSLWPPIKSLWFTRGTGDRRMGVLVGCGNESKIGNQN